MCSLPAPVICIMQGPKVSDSNLIWMPNVWKLNDEIGKVFSTERVYYFLVGFLNEYTHYSYIYILHGLHRKGEGRVPPTSNTAPLELGGAPVVSLGGGGAGEG